MDNGTALCPSSLYANMAYTVSEHLYNLLRSDSPSVEVNVSNMIVSKPFIAESNARKGQTIRISATENLSHKKVDLVFTSGSSNSIVEHDNCHVEYVLGATWLTEWQRTAYLIKGRIDSLKKAAGTGSNGGSRRALTALEASQQAES